MKQVLSIDPANAQRAYNKGDKSIRQAFQELWPDYNFNKSIKERITSYADACSEVGIIPLTISDFAALPQEDQESTYAYHQLTIIAKALNEGWVPDYSNGNEYKYYPYFIWGGSGFSSVGYDFAVSGSRVGARLTFKSRELAEYAGKQFISIYNQYLIKQ